MKILIVDDNKQITAILKKYCEREGYDVLLASDGVSALNIFETEQLDLILLDVMMPKLDGFSVCKKIRETSTIPIIMITARNEDVDRIMGLDIGADDYIVKPFSNNEVMARIRAVLRRLKVENSTIESYDNIIVDIENYEVRINNEDIFLTKKEFELLWLLIKNPNKVFSRDSLLDLIWGYDYYGDNRTIDSHIKRLRSKLSDEDHDKWQITTVWGVGYKFETK